VATDCADDRRLGHERKHSETLRVRYLEAGGSQRSARSAQHLLAGLWCAFSGSARCRSPFSIHVAMATG